MRTEGRQSTGLEGRQERIRDPAGCPTGLKMTGPLLLFPVHKVLPHSLLPESHGGGGRGREAVQERGFGLCITKRCPS